jgi:nucleotide-binding universal stress UspA family protein
MSYRVLVAVDEDEARALDQARYVARLPDADETVRATVLYVVPPGEFTQAENVAFEDVTAAVDAADYLTERGIDVERVVDDGGVPQEILRTADEVDVDEVVLGGRKRSGVAGALLGSVVQDVFRSAERPVTLAGEGVTFREGTRRVLVPVDRDAERAGHQAEYVARLPGVPGSVEATVLYVFAHQDYTGAPPHSFDEVDAAVDVADRLEREGVAVERLAVGGEVTRKILAEADGMDADQVVMAGRKRSGIQKVLLGSTVQDVLLSSERPVTLTG